MGEFYNKPELKKIRKQLRNEATQAEQLLWEQLKGKKLHGAKFRRQYSVGRFVLDFYCVSSKLGIEVDGGYHQDAEQKEYDAIKENDIKASGIKLLRFTNEQIVDEMPKVLSVIESSL